MIPTLFLVRHGLAAPPGVLAGRTDFSLRPEGAAQADAHREALSGHRFSAAWSSPLARARQTAKIILRGNSGNTRTLVSVPDLCEIDLGEWDGKNKEWIIRQYLEEWQARGRDFVHTPPPGGESFANLAARVLPAFKTLCDQAKRHPASLLVAHQAVNRVILSHLTGMPLSLAPYLSQPLGALTLIRFEPEGHITVSLPTHSSES